MAKKKEKKVYAPYQFTERDQELIRSLRNLPVGPFNSKKTQPNSLEQPIDSLMTQFKIGIDKPQAVLMQHWKEIMGAQLAHRTCPITISQTGLLTIGVSNAVIKSELEFQKLDILKKIQSFPECAGIQRIMLKLK